LSIPFVEEGRNIKILRWIGLKLRIEKEIEKGTHHYKHIKNLQ